MNNSAYTRRPIHRKTKRPADRRAGRQAFLRRHLAVERLEDRRVFAAVVTSASAGGLSALADFLDIFVDVDQILPEEAQDRLSSDAGLGNTLTYQAFQGEFNEVQIGQSISDFFYFIKEGNSFVPVISIPLAFHPKLVEDLSAGFSFVVHLEVKIGQFIDIPDANAVVPNAKSLLEFLPGIGGPDGILTEMTNLLGSGLSFGLGDIVQFIGDAVGFVQDVVNSTIGPITSAIGDVAYTICRVIDAIPFVNPDCEEVKDFTEEVVSSFTSDLPILPLVPPGLLEFGVGLVEALTSTFTTESVYVSTLDGPDSIDLSLLNGVGQLVYAGTENDTITSGSGDQPIRLYGEEGDDTFILNNTFLSDLAQLFLYGGEGNDALTIGGSDGNDIIRLVGSGGRLARIVREAANPGAGVTANEVQVVTLPTGTSGGTFTLQFRGQTTAPISYNAPASGVGSVTEALENLSNIAPGDVVVSGTTSGPYTVTFQGAYAQTDVPNLVTNGSNLQVTGGTMTVTTTVQASSGLGTNEKQQVTLPSRIRSGTFTLSFNGNTTSALAYDASAQDVQDALTDLASIGAGNVEVTGVAGGPYTIEFTGSLGQQNQPAVTADGSLLVANVAASVSEVTRGQAGVNETQRISVQPGATGGTFTLDFNGKATRPIPYDASVATIQDEIGRLSTVVSPANIRVTGANGGPWDIEFVNDLRELDQPVLTYNSNDLRGGVSLGITESNGSGTNEKQSITTNGATSGTFTLRFNNGTFARTTGPLFEDATPGEIQTALEALTSVGRGNVVVTGPVGGPWTVEFIGDLAAADQRLLMMDGSGLNTGYVTFAINAVETIPGNAVPPVEEEQTITINATGGMATGGTFTLTSPSGAGSVTTAPIAFNADGAAVDAAFAAAGLADIEVAGPAGGPYTVTFIGTLANQNITGLFSGDASLLSGNTAEIQAAVPGVNEVQTITPSPALLTSGDFTLRFGSDTTSPIAYNATGAEVQSALQALPSIGTGNVTVTGPAGGPWTATFTGRLSKQNLAALIPNATNLGGALGLSITDNYVTASVGTDEVQSFQFDPAANAGTYTLSFGGATTTPLAYNASASTVETALEALSTIDDVSVSGCGSGTCTVTFAAPSNLRARNVPLLLVDTANLTRSGLTITVTDNYVAAALPNEIQRIALPFGVTAGTFTLAFNGSTTASLPYTARGSDLQTALAALPTIGAGNVRVSGPQKGPWTVEFIGTLANTDVNLIVADGTALTVDGGAATVNETTKGNDGADNVILQTTTIQTIDSVEQLIIQLENGQDKLIVEGDIGFPLGLIYDGGDATDYLELYATNTSPSFIAPVFPDDTQAVLTMNSQNIEFSNVEGGILFHAGGRGATVTVSGTDAGNEIRFAGTSSGNATFANDGQVTITLQNFGANSTIEVKAGQGEDTISLAPNGVSEFTQFLLQGEGPAGADSVRFEGTTGADTFAYRPAPGSVEEGFVEYDLGGGNRIQAEFRGMADVEFIGLGGVDSLTVAEPTAGSTDIILFLPALGNDGSFTHIVQNAGAATALVYAEVTYKSMETRTFNTGTGADYFGYYFDDVPGVDSDLFADGGNGTTVLGYEDQTVTFIHDTTEPDSLDLQIGSGVDTFQITPGVALNIDVRGGLDWDRLNYQSPDVTVTVDLASRTISAPGYGDVYYTSTERLDIAARGTNNALVLQGKPEDSDLTYTPLSATAGRFKAGFVAAEVWFDGIEGTVTVSTAPATDDRLLVQFGPTNETITVTGTEVGGTASGPLKGIQFTEIESLLVFGNEGADRFLVTAASIPIFLDGGGPVGGQPGDRAEFSLGGTSSTTFWPGPDGDSGHFTIGTNRPVSFDQLESAVVTSASSALVFGTHGPDAVTVMARDSATDPGADGSRDFTVSVDAGIEVLYLNTAVLGLNTLSGSDQISLRTTAPSGAPWDVNVTVDGGEPSSASDELLIVTPFVPGSLVPNPVIYTPQSANQATLVLNASNTTINLLQIERLRYDGDADGDAITVRGGTNNNDTFVHLPGLAADEGSIRVNQLLPLEYKNVGSTATLTMDGQTGTDTLLYQGTASSDAMTVFSNGVIGLQTPAGSHVPVGTLSVENLTLDTLAGDDTIGINQAPGLIPASLHPYTNIRVLGGEPSASDSLYLSGTSGPEAVTINLDPATINGLGGTISYTGFEHVYLDLNQGGDQLTVNGTSLSDEFTYTPTGSLDGQFARTGENVQFRFADVDQTFSIVGGVGTADRVNLLGTQGRDTITIDANTRVAAVNLLKAVVLDTTTESLQALGRDDQDMFVVIPLVGVTSQPSLDNLRIDLDGGTYGLSDALVIAANTAGAPLPATHFVVVNRGPQTSEGRVRIFQDQLGVNNLPFQLPDIGYRDVELISAQVAVTTTGDPNLLIMGPDLNEPNEFRPHATFLGSGSVVQEYHATIFVPAGEFSLIPADQDYYRVVAEKTGILDVRVFFNQYSAELLPGGGDLSIEVRDATGDLMTSMFGGARVGSNNDDSTESAGLVEAAERARFPVVAGQTYYLRVFGKNTSSPDDTYASANRVLNGYHVQILNTEPPVPYDLELVDIVFRGTLTSASLASVTVSSAATPATDPALSPVDDFYNGKYLHFLDGPQAGRRVLIVDYTGGTRTFVFAPGSLGGTAPQAGNLIVIESYDSGRSQLDNVTRDTSPVIRFRLDDAILLNDLPGNPTAAFPPDEVISLPWNATQSAVPGNGMGGTSPAGYRVAIYLEGQPQQSGTSPQQLVGYARKITAAGDQGVYEFDFGRDALVGGSLGELALSNGSHFLSARLEMIDPALPAPASSRIGYGVRSRALELLVDQVLPPVYFGNPNVPLDGLANDPGVIPQPGTVVDQKTNDSTPRFWGVAEANAVVRVYVDNEVAAAAGDGTIGSLDIFDVLVGLAVAKPVDGTNQFPFGQWELESTVDLNNPLYFNPPDGLRTVFVVAEDAAGNLNAANGQAGDTLQIFLDTQGPQVAGLYATVMLGLLSNNTLVRFHATSPQVFDLVLPISGLAPNQSIVGIDRRAANGMVYAVVDSPTQDALYTLNPATGEATFAVNLSQPLSGTQFGVDFNALQDRLWIVSDTGTNYEVNPLTGVVTVRTAVTPPGTQVSGIAFTQNSLGAPSSPVLYTIDSQGNVLNRQEPANGGVQTVVGNLAVDVTASIGFDVAPENNIAFASLTNANNNQTGFYVIDLTTGQATLLDLINDGSQELRGLTSISEYDIFDPKPSTDGPTPLISHLFIRLQDQPARELPFDNPAANPLVAESVGHYQLKGDANGIIPIQRVDFIPDPVLEGQPARGTIVLTFSEPIPDDRFTLLIDDGLVDDVGNQLDGESNAREPQEQPLFPSGDGQPGGDFVARFTVDSRAEVGVWSAGTVHIDSNGNNVWDTHGRDGDYVNRDVTYVLGYTSDNIFGGNFASLVNDPNTPEDERVADRFHKLAAYGKLGSNFRWLIDTNNDGVPDLVVTNPEPLNGLPLAGNFDGKSSNGDEVALRVGSTWYLDTNRSFSVDASERLPGLDMIGWPVVGDFDGDRIDDLATWVDDQYFLDLSSIPDPTTGAQLSGRIERQFRLGITSAFIGVQERPIAADFDGDKIDDLGLWVPKHNAGSPDAVGEWYVLLSDGRSITQRIRQSPQDGQSIVDFVPEPFGRDLFLVLGSDYALPVVGNFDPHNIQPALGGLTIGLTNWDDAQDVNGDGYVTPIDVLLLINEINRSGPRSLTAGVLGGPFYDVNRDWTLTSADALNVINRINRSKSQPSGGEGEFGALPNAYPAAVSMLPDLRMSGLFASSNAVARPSLIQAHQVDKVFGQPWTAWAPRAADQAGQLESQGEETSDSVAMEDDILAIIESFIRIEPRR